MIYTISVLRYRKGDEKSHWQNFSYESKSSNDTVATALLELNMRAELKDIEGNPAERIEWECSCLQKKCGACAMVVNGRPRLACDSVLESLKTDIIKLMPLKKFPVVRDLMVDRSIMYENLKLLKIWLNEDAELSEYYRDLQYDASECLQCGCCLEVCPNFYAEGRFFGMAAVPLTTRVLTQTDKENFKKLTKLYNKHVFEGCGKSLACKDICPKKIDTEQLLVNANALAVWKRKKDKKEKK